MMGVFPTGSTDTEHIEMARDYSPSEMDGGGLSATTAVALLETGSAAIRAIALTL